MQDTKIWNMLVKHLANEESTEEKEKFHIWFNQSEKNKEVFYKVKNVWEGKEITQAVDTALTFRGRFTPQKIKDFVLKQALGNLVGFTVGMWVTTTFSHQVLERKSLKNLFGLAGRKNVEVNEIPKWLQHGIAILMGFIALELINHFFQTKKHIMVWDYFRKKVAKV